METRNKFRDNQAALVYMLAGNARMTVVSLKTGTRFTYKVRQPRPDSPWFVSVLTGSDNESDYTFLGTIFQDNNYRHGRRSPIGQDAPSAKAFVWLWATLNSDKVHWHHAELWHEGRCGRCARPLTVPSSIELGLGPECAGKAA